MLYIYRNKLKQDSHLYNIIHIQDYTMYDIDYIKGFQWLW